MLTDERVARDVSGQVIRWRQLAICTMVAWRLGPCEGCWRHSKIVQSETNLTKLLYSVFLLGRLNPYFSLTDLSAAVVMYTTVPNQTSKTAVAWQPAPGAFEYSLKIVWALSWGCLNTTQLPLLPLSSSVLVGLWNELLQRTFLSPGISALLIMTIITQRQTSWPFPSNLA